MGLDSLLTHTCTIQPVGGAATDSGGNKVDIAGTPVTGVACRLEPLTAEEKEQNIRDGVIATHRLWLAAGTTIDERGTITTVADGAGTTLVGVCDIEAKNSISGRSRIHHLEVLIKEVRSSG